MAQADAGEQEYESDPEELKRSLATRRREASDDEDEDEDDEEVKNQRAEIESDSDQSDERVDNDNDKKGEDGEDSYEEEEGDDEYRELEEVDDDKRSKPAEDDAAGRVDGEEDKEKQSSAVPTGGAFYMRDDRFQELSAGRSRYTLFFFTIFSIAIAFIREINRLKGGVFAFGFCYEWVEYLHLGVCYDRFG